MRSPRRGRRAWACALGLLRVPALYVVALWLRDEGGAGGGDLLMPLAPRRGAVN